MNPTDKVDDLLAKAGAEWRASQPSAPEPDLDRITGARRKRRWLIPTLAAAGVAAIATAALIVLPDNNEPAVAPPPGQSDVPTPAIAKGTVPGGTSSADDLLVRNGDRVEVNGEIIAAPGKEPVFCAPVAHTAIGYPSGEEPAPTCGPDVSVQLIGLDLGRLSSPTVIKGVRSGGAHVTGIWKDRTITVEEQSALRVDQPSPNDPIPCPAPPGGWPSIPSNILTKPVQDFLKAKADVISGSRSSYPAGNSRNAPRVIVIGVAHGDLEAFRKTFETVYQGNLCVFRGKVSRADSTKVGDALVTLTMKRRDLGVFRTGGEGGDDGVVGVGLLVLDEKAKAAFAPIGLEKLDFEVSVKPVR